MQEDILEIANLTKKYKNKIALNNVSLTFRYGLHGLIGANGAGKSTLMNALCGAINIDSGKIIFNGSDVTRMPQNYRSKMRMLYQKPPLLPDYTVEEVMLYGGVLFGLSKKNTLEQIDDLLNRVGLQDMKRVKTKALSGGMKQRLAIAQILLGESKILLLDEPTVGLDIMERLKFKMIINSLKKDHIIIYSTHIYSDLENIADDVSILVEGKKAEVVSVASLKTTTIQDYFEKGIIEGKW